MWSSLAYGGEAERQNVSERQPLGCGGGGSHLWDQTRDRNKKTKHWRFADGMKPFFFCFTARRSWVQIQDIYGVKCTTLDNFKKKDQNRLTDQIWVFNKYTMPAGDSFFLLHWHFIWMNLESWNRRNSSRLMDHQSDLYKKSNWWTLALMQSVRQLIPLWAPAER